LRLANGEQALLDAQKCKMIRPSWSKAWYLEGAALKLLKVYLAVQQLASNLALHLKLTSSLVCYISAQNYEGAANAFLEALKLDPEIDEIKTALRQ
jgi:tetratricopeptide (TPR) repeat protein